MKNTLYQQFLRFCKSKPENEEYNYMDTSNCPLAQFGKTLFPRNKTRVRGSDKLVLLRMTKKNPLSRTETWEKRMVVLTTPKQVLSLTQSNTFGDLVNRLTTKRTKKPATWRDSYGL